MRLFAWIRKMFFLCYNNNVLRYIFYGGLTTLVNLGVYALERKLFGIPVLPANVISVAASILFAYFTNSRFVFHTKARGFGEHFSEFVRFVGARLSTMAIEVFGVTWMAEGLHIDDMVAKFVTQFIVLALNYVFSKFLIFTKGRKREDTRDNS